MKTRRLRVALTLIALVFVAACEGQSVATDPTATPTRATTQAPDVKEHESGPESPMTYGLQVPKGATQLGPLIRFRSPRLIAAYEPELRAAQAQKDAEAREKEAEKEADGTPPTPSTPTPDTRPSDDSFKLLDNPPKPDSAVSLMRIDGSPTDVVLRMVAQIDAALPDADLATNDLSQYCSAKDRRITRCHLAVRGLAKGDRDIRITMTVDPGNVKTRTSTPSALTHPVMTVLIEYVGEPRKGQLDQGSHSLENVADVDPDAELSGLIWPKMDEDAPPTTRLLNGWTAPSDAAILLSGRHPAFVMLTDDRAADADLTAEQYVTAGSKGPVTKDVVEDLNEVSTTYTAQTKNGGTLRSTYVLSARGNYTALFYLPPPN